MWGQRSTKVKYFLDFYRDHSSIGIYKKQRATNIYLSVPIIWRVAAYTSQWFKCIVKS